MELSWQLWFMLRSTGINSRWQIGLKSVTCMLILVPQLKGLWLPEACSHGRPLECKRGMPNTQPKFQCQIKLSGQAHGQLDREVYFIHSGRERRMNICWARMKTLRIFILYIAKSQFSHINMLHLPKRMISFCLRGRTTFCSSCDLTAPILMTEG